MIKYKCPECEELLEYLNYYTNGYCYGSFDISEGSYNCDGDEFDGGTTYSCTECGHDIEDPESLEQIEVDDDDETIVIERRPNGNIEKTIRPVIEEGIYEQRGNRDGINYIKCKKCKSKIIIEEEDIDTHVKCKKCKKEILVVMKEILDSNKEGII